MAAHKFRIGENLDFSPRRVGSPEASRQCQILRLLPAEDGEPQYRIKCNAEAVERVVKEYTLSIRRI